MATSPWQHRPFIIGKQDQKQEDDEEDRNNVLTARHNILCVFIRVFKVLMFND